jgi:hypothetical protein
MPLRGAKNGVRREVTPLLADKKGIRARRMGFSAPRECEADNQLRPYRDNPRAPRSREKNKTRLVKKKNGGGFSHRRLETGWEPALLLLALGGRFGEELVVFLALLLGQRGLDLAGELGAHLPHLLAAVFLRGVLIR